MRLLDRILPPAWNNLEENSFVLEDWRLWFGGVMSLIFLVVLPLVFLVDFPYFLANEHYVLIAVDTAVWLLLLARTLFPTRKYIYSRYLWVAVIYIMAISFFVVLGPTYARSAWLVFCVVMTALFFGPKAALIMSLFNGLLIMGLYGFMDPGDTAWAETYRLGFRHWLVFAVSASLLSFGASIPVGFLLVRLDKALKRSNAINEQLAMERSQLDRANNELQSQMQGRALAQMALMESEEKLRLMADNLPNTVIYQMVSGTDGSRRFVYMSRSVERLNEVTAEEVMADAGVMYSQVAPECVDELAAKEKKALESLATFRHTVRTVLPSGKVRWFDLASTPRRNKDGSVTWDGVQVDVTDREQAKQALRESEKLYRALVENSHAGVAMVDDAFHYIYVNDEFCRILGYEHEELLDMDLRETLAEETAHIAEDNYLARQRGDNPPSRYELMVKRKDGVKRWLEIRSSVINDTVGKVRTVAQFLDITESKKAEDALRESEARFSAMVENSHDGIVLVDREFHLTYVNDEFCVMTGYPREEIVGQDFRQFLAEETSHIPVEHYLGRLRGEEPSPVYEFMIMRKDGEKIWVEVKSSEITDAKGDRFIVGQLLDITERREAEEALRQSESLYRSLVEHSHAGIALFDESFRFEYVNDVICMILGHSPEELLGRNGKEFVAEESVQEVMQNFAARQRGEYVPERYAVVVVRKDGEKRWLEVSGSTLASPDGRKRTLAQFLDITERKAAEEALRESENLYRALVDNSHDGIILLDDYFRIKYVNDEYCDILGYPPEELVGRDFRQFLAAETKQVTVEHYLAKLRGEESVSRYEFMVERKDGAKRLLQATSSPIVNAKGEQYIMAQLLDITERKKAEEALRQSENLYRALVENSHSGIVLIDDQHRYEYVNDEHCKIMGYPHEEIIGRDFRQFLAPETAHVPQEHYLARQRGENPPARYEYMVVRKDGEKRWVEVSASIIADAEGKVHTVAQLLDITGRKKAVDALRESENLYRALAENSHAGIGLLDDSFRFTYVNDELCKMSGYSREELMGMEGTALVAEESVQTLTNNFMARRRGEPVPERYDIVGKRKDGEKRRVEISSSVITDSKGAVCTLSQFLDVTERKAAEEALRQSEQRFRASFDSAFQFAGLLTPDGRMLEANQTALDFIGLTMEEVEGTPFWKAPWWRGHPEHQERIKDAVRRAAAGETIRFEAENVGLEGEKIYVDFSLKPIFDKEGKVVMLLPEGRDITDRVEALEALRQSEEKFRQVIQASPMGVFMYELAAPDRLVFVGANPAAESILRVDTGKFTGKTVEEVFPLIAETDLVRRMRDIAAHGSSPIKNEPIEYRDDRINGFFELHIFQTAPGKLTVMFQDVSERKMAEAEKARLESQLRQSQKMEAVGTLTSGIAHDFNNILGAILGTTEASLLKGNEDISPAKSLGSIRDMSIRGRDLVRRLLSFSRQDEQAMRILDIGDLVAESMELIKAALPSNVALEKKLAHGLWVMADPVQIQQVLLNLCTNAAHAMEENGGTLFIKLSSKRLSQDQARMHPDLHSGSYVLLEVADTGGGIPRHVIDRIFDPFFTTKPMGRGTGLGLSLVHGIIKSHHGSITAISQEGEGTTMSLLLPQKAQMGVAAQEPKKSAPMDGRGEHIMVVDDEEIIARSTGQTLEALGYRVSAYTSALEAAAALEHDPKRYDLVLTDHMMPGLTGRQLAEIAGELNPGLPVVLMTGMYGGTEERGQAGEVAKVLTKPVTIREIGQTVRQVLDAQDQSTAKASA